MAQDIRLITELGETPNERLCRDDMIMSIVQAYYTEHSDSLIYSDTQIRLYRKVMAALVEKRASRLVKDKDAEREAWIEKALEVGILGNWVDLETGKQPIYKDRQSVESQDLIPGELILTVESARSGGKTISLNDVVREIAKLSEDDHDYNLLKVPSYLEKMIDRERRELNRKNKVTPKQQLEIDLAQKLSIEINRGKTLYSALRSVFDDLPLGTIKWSTWRDWGAGKTKRFDETLQAHSSAVLEVIKEARDAARVSESVQD